MYTLEGVSSVATSLLLMKSLNKTETPIFVSVVCSLFPKANFLTFIPLPLGVWEGLRFVIVALPRLFFYPFLSVS